MGLAIGTLILALIIVFVLLPLALLALPYFISKWQDRRGPK